MRVREIVMERMIRIIGIFVGLGLLYFNLLRWGYGQGVTSNENREFSINLKSKALVLGPKITLGDIGVLEIPDRIKKEKLASIILGDAAPPGESRELSLSYIKRCLKRAGFEEFNSYIRGSRMIRVTTAPVEIDKAILKDGFAFISRNEFFKITI